MGTLLRTLWQASFDPSKIKSGEDQVNECSLKDGETQRPAANYDPTVRRVVCAANRYPNGVIITGARHWDKIMHQTVRLMRLEGEAFDGKEEQGFIDTHGEFLTREQAWIVAFHAKQIIRRCGGDGKKLFSENLY